MKRHHLIILVPMKYVTGAYAVNVMTGRDRAELWEQITSFMEDCHLAFSASAAISSLAAAYTSIEFQQHQV